MISFDPAHAAVYYPADRRFRIWIRPSFLFGIAALAVLPILFAWVQWLTVGLPYIPPIPQVYLHSFSPNVKGIFDRFEFQAQIERLSKAEFLYLVTEKFTTIDLHPDRVSNADMGTIFEELIRKFAELSNETAGEHFTPREVIRLMVDLIFAEDDEVLSNPNVVRTIYGPTAGTGGMLSVAGEWLHEHNPKARLTVFGQELNDESYAICKADMLIKGQDVSSIKPGERGPASMDLRHSPL